MADVKTKPSKISDLVYPLADVLQLRLGIHRPPKDKDKPRIVTVGDPKKAYRLSAHSGLVLKNEVKASFLNDRIAAMLMRVRKDLFMYVVYQTKTDEFVILVLDADKVPMTPQMISKIDGLHPRDAKMMLMPAIVMEFRKRQAETLWTRKKPNEVGAVDSGQGSSPPEGSSPADSSGGG